MAVEIADIHSGDHGSKTQANKNGEVTMKHLQFVMTVILGAVAALLAAPASAQWTTTGDLSWTPADSHVTIGANYVREDTQLMLHTMGDGPNGDPVGRESVLRFHYRDFTINNGAYVNSYGQIEWSGDDENPGAGGVRASLEARAWGAGTRGEVGLFFRTSGIETNANQTRMVISDEGTVGIGIGDSTDDAVKLQVGGKTQIEGGNEQTHLVLRTVAVNGNLDPPAGTANNDQGENLLEFHYRDSQVNGQNFVNSYGSIIWTGTDENPGAGGIRASIEAEAFGAGSQGETGLFFRTSYINTDSNQTAMVISHLRNIGIGTENPDAKLHVVGPVKIDDGTQGAGFVLTSDANGLASWQPAGGGGGSVWSVNGDDAFRPIGNVGIGTDSPEQLLHLRSGGPNTTIRLENTSESAGGAFGGPIDEPLGTLEFASQIANQGYFSLNNPRVKITGVAQNSSGGAALLFYTANSTEADPTSRMRIMADGSVAINSTGAYAQAKLDVDGQIRLAGGSPGAGKVLTSDANGVGSWETPSDGGGGTAGPAGAAGEAGAAGAAGEAGAQGAQGKQGPPGQDASSDCVDCADVQTVVFDASCKIFAGDFSNTAQFSECIGVLASFKLLGTEVCDGTFGGEANCLDFIISNVQDLIDEKLNP